MSSSTSLSCDVPVTFDFKGSQYRGNILPGPTAMVAGFKGGQLRVEAITDEFVRLFKTQDVMAKMDAIVKGDMDENAFRYHEENVNYAQRDPAQPGKKQPSDSGKKGGKKPAPKKQQTFKPPPVATKRRKSGGGSATKRRKTAQKK